MTNSTVPSDKASGFVVRDIFLRGFFHFLPRQNFFVVRMLSGRSLHSPYHVPWHGMKGLFFWPFLARGISVYKLARVFGKGTLSLQTEKSHTDNQKPTKMYKVFVSDSKTSKKSSKLFVIFLFSTTTEEVRCCKVIKKCSTY